MALNAAFKDSLLFETEENKSIEEAGYILKKGLVNYFSTVQEEREHEQAREKLLDFTENSIKKYAYFKFKSNTSLEPYEIEQVKKALTNYVCNDKHANELKKELIEDLTNFQHQIITTQHDKLMELVNEKDNYEKELRILECEKNKHIMEKLTQIAWPYDAKTKKYDLQITKLKAKVEHYAKKIENSRTMRPVATEKDIMFFHMNLKEKFAAK